MTRFGSSRPPIVVVGAGIVGASLAYHLASRGASVTLLEASLPASGATGSSFAWIGRPVASKLPSAPLRYIAIDEYLRLERELPDFRILWPGSLTWGGQGSSARPGGEVTDLHALEPGLISPPARAHFAPTDGAFDPVEGTESLVAAAVARGAELRVGTPVTRLVRERDTVVGVETADGLLPAATVVVAAGTGTPALCSSVGVDVPVRSSPSVLVRLRAAPGTVRTILDAPELEVRQCPDGTLLAPVRYSGETNRTALRATAERVRQKVTETFGIPEAEILSAEIGWRPMPIDDEPIIGRAPGAAGLYVAVMHSAVTLGAAAGRLVAEELVTGDEAPELAGCRIDRFTR
ncbi:MAG TPA: FAD-binding oxidoreductase [Candidatus Agrococcus pullicola]|uniref:FAD-binding oxidoreductase n=1 Tax=Candidatus Agrococcus pullicola TaxID=2838429 RepID=A0A9D1YXR4_9MICO|nr:FAD-binding oxidoreductase [Candidatus Agrococcus pullicola]